MSISDTLGGYISFYGSIGLTHFEGFLIREFKSIASVTHLVCICSSIMSFRNAEISGLWPWRSNLAAVGRGSRAERHGLLSHTLAVHQHMGTWRYRCSVFPSETTVHQRHFLDERHQSTAKACRCTWPWPQHHGTLTVLVLSGLTVGEAGSSEGTE